jgi:hypothetical protein
MPAWVSPYEHEKIVALTNEVLPEVPAGIWRSFIFGLAGWLGKELVARAKALHLPAPTEAVQKLSKDFRAARLARSIAREILMESVTARAPDLSRQGLGQICKRQLGSDSLLAEIDLADLFALVGYELETAAKKNAGLARIVLVRKAIIERIASEIQRPDHERDRLMRIQEGTIARLRKFEEKGRHFYDSLLAINILRSGGSTSALGEIKGLLDEIGDFGTECLGDIADWTRDFVVPEEARNVKVSANFMLKKDWDPNAKTSYPEASEADHIWIESAGTSEYVKQARDRLSILYAVDRDLLGFWVPLIRGNPLPGAPFAVQKDRIDVVFVDDLEPRWPDEAKSLLDRLRQFFRKQSFQMFLSLPVKHPKKPSGAPIGVLNINFAEINYAYYDHDTIARVAVLLAPLADFFGQLSVVTQWAVQTHEQNKPVLTREIETLVDRYRPPPLLLQESGDEQ